MALPDLIEIFPLTQPVWAEVTVPGSKSITNRALILAALANGQTTLTGALWSEDTQVMIDCLNRLGFKVRVEPDPNEAANRTIRVQGLGGAIPPGGSAAKPLDLFVGNAGTAARFLAALVCLGTGVYRLSGVARMHERPQAALFDALRQLGYRIESENDRLPAIIHGAGPRPGLCFVSITESSQFASALLLCARTAGWEIEVAGENEEESPYVTMTSKVVETFSKAGGQFQVEADASSGSYFIAAAANQIERLDEHSLVDGRLKRQWISHPTVRVAHWPDSGWQIDSHFDRLFQKITFGSDHFNFEKPSTSLTPGPTWRDHIRESLAAFEAAARADHRPPHIPNSPELDWRLGGRRVSRRTDLGDSIMTAITMAPLAVLPLEFTDLGRLRLQECERVAALRTELTRCGAKVVESGDTLLVYPADLHGAEIETYHDHRMAMSFAILGLKVPGIKIKNPACVKKTFPNFFQKLVAPPPHGLGAIILDARTRRPLDATDLFAH